MSLSPDVVAWTCRVFAKLGYEMFDQDLGPEIWRWMEAEGLSTCLATINRHGHEFVIPVILSCSQAHFSDLFETRLPALLRNEASLYATV
jgi:hypothetical protein